jgi:hypothetical protein
MQHDGKAESIKWIEAVKCVTLSEQLMFTATALGVNMYCMNGHGLVKSPSCFVRINWQPPEDRQRLQLWPRA